MFNLNSRMLGGGSFFYAEERMADFLPIDGRMCF